MYLTKKLSKQLNITFYKTSHRHNNIEKYKEVETLLFHSHTHERDKLMYKQEMIGQQTIAFKAIGINILANTVQLR